MKLPSRRELPPHTRPRTWIYAGRSIPNSFRSAGLALNNVFASSSREME
jgi:hypothetical protein